MMNIIAPCIEKMIQLCMVLVLNPYLKGHNNSKDIWHKQKCLMKCHHTDDPCNPHDDQERYWYFEPVPEMNQC